jgi:hypothetical protein
VIRLIKLGDALSQFFNVLIFGGDPNYSISGDAYRYKRVWLMRIIDLLASPFEADHCEKAYINDVLKARKLLDEANEPV